MKVARRISWSHRRTISGGIKELILSPKMTSTLGQDSSLAEHFDKAEIDVRTLEHFQSILDSKEIDLTEFSNDMSYLGFDKNKIALMAARNLGALRTVKLCLLGGIRGTNLSKIFDKSAKVDAELQKLWRDGKIKSNGSGPNDLTMGRLMATFPEITAHYMERQKIPKKLYDLECPASLQFPAAAGLPMSPTVRAQHVEFAVKFAFLISGDKKFHATYYRAAFTGQQPVKRLSNTVRPLVGSPTDSDSRSVDIEVIFKELIAKYGEERFVMYEAQNRGVSSGKKSASSALT